MSIIKHTLWASHVRHSFIPASNVPLGVQIPRPLGRKEQARSCSIACCGVFVFLITVCGNSRLKSFKLKDYKEVGNRKNMALTSKDGHSGFQSALFSCLLPLLFIVYFLKQMLTY